MAGDEPADYGLKRRSVVSQPRLLSYSCHVAAATLPERFTKLGFKDFAGT